MSDSAGSRFVLVDFNEEIRDSVFRLRKPETVSERLRLYFDDGAEILIVEAEVVAPQEAALRGTFDRITDPDAMRDFRLARMGCVSLPLPGRETGLTA